MTLAPMKVKGVSKADAEKKALELLERVGLADRANAYQSSSPVDRNSVLRS